MPVYLAPELQNPVKALKTNVLIVLHERWDAALTSNFLPKYEWFGLFHIKDLPFPLTALCQSGFRAHPLITPNFNFDLFLFFQGL